MDDIIDWLREWGLVVLCWCTNAHHTRTPTPPHVITTVKLLISSHLCKWFQQCNWILRIHCALGPSLKRIRRSQAVRRCLREEGSSICKHCRSAARRAGLEGDPAQEERQLPPAAIWYGGLNCRIGKRTPYYPYLSLSPVVSYVIVMGLSMTARVGDCWNAHAICTQVWVGLVITAAVTHGDVHKMSFLPKFNNIYVWDAVKLKLASIDLGLLIIIHIGWVYFVPIYTLDS